MFAQQRVHSFHRQIALHVQRFGVADAQRVFSRSRKYIRYHAQEHADGTLMCLIISLEKCSWGGARNFALSEADELDLSVLLLDYIKRHPTEGLKVKALATLS